MEEVIVIFQVVHPQIYYMQQCIEVGQHFIWIYIPVAIEQLEVFFILFLFLVRQKIRDIYMFLLQGIVLLMEQMLLQDIHKILIY